MRCRTYARLGRRRSARERMLQSARGSSHMEAATIGSNTIELVSAVGGARSLVGVADEVSPFPLKEFRFILGEAIRLCQDERDRLRHNLNLPNREQTNERLDADIAITDLIAQKIEDLVDSAERVRSTLIQIKVWEGIQTLATLAEELRDLEETYALGRSSRFRAKIKRAKQRASA